MGEVNGSVEEERPAARGTGLLVGRERAHQLGRDRGGRMVLPRLWAELQPTSTDVSMLRPSLWTGEMEHMWVGQRELQR